MYVSVCMWFFSLFKYLNFRISFFFKLVLLCKLRIWFVAQATIFVQNQMESNLMNCVACFSSPSSYNAAIVGDLPNQIFYYWACIRKQIDIAYSLFIYWLLPRWLVDRAWAHPISWYWMTACVCACELCISNKLSNILYAIFISPNLFV